MKIIVFELATFECARFTRAIINWQMCWYICILHTFGAEWLGVYLPPMHVCHSFCPFSHLRLENVPMNTPKSRELNLDLKWPENDFGKLFLIWLQLPPLMQGICSHHQRSSSSFANCLELLSHWKRAEKAEKRGQCYKQCQGEKLPSALVTL